MNEFAEAAKIGGRNTTIFGVIAIMLGLLAMLAPGLTGISVVLIVGVLVVAGGIVRMIWAFQADNLGKGDLTREPSAQSFRIPRREQRTRNEQGESSIACQHLCRELNEKDAPVVRSPC